MEKSELRALNDQIISNLDEMDKAKAEGNDTHYLACVSKDVCLKAKLDEALGE